MDEVKSKRLRKAEEAIIGDKLLVGIPTKRIKMEEKLEPVLVRKYKINETRHEDGMIATSLKVQEWKINGKNHAFFFKNMVIGHLSSICFTVKVTRDFMKIILLLLT
ncbi:hypothetical protein HUJ05_012208 [Dendroctonus ponderosae]|nr:hypothetical protein HUJ05_012208 [Dendroctonus ponderosae]